MCSLNSPPIQRQQKTTSNGKSFPLCSACERRLSNPSHFHSRHREARGGEPQNGLFRLLAVRKRVLGWRPHGRSAAFGEEGRCPYPNGLPDQHSLGQSLRRRHRVSYALRFQALAAPWSPSLAKERGSAACFFIQAERSINMMSKLSREHLNKGVICSSAGNHAQGVALAAKKLKCDAVIAMPVTTPEIKWKSVETLDAKVVLVGDSYDEAQAYAKQRAKQDGRTFIPPFDHPDIIMGQGTIGMEVVRQLKGPLHAVFVPVGGGGLIAGIAAYVKRVRPEVKVVGVEPFDANAMALLLHHGQRIMLEQVGGFADGVAVKVVGEETFRLCRELVDGVVLVSRDAICAAIKISGTRGNQMQASIDQGNTLVNTLDLHFFRNVDRFWKVGLMSVAYIGEGSFHFELGRMKLESGNIGFPSEIQMQAAILQGHVLANKLFSFL